MRTAILDAGPLVAFLDRAEAHHAWVVEQLKTIDVPLLVCEPVLTEALHILKRRPSAQDFIFELLENSTLSLAFNIADQIAGLRRLYVKYRDRPMSLADACIVRMAEIYDAAAVFTIDSDFSVYRKNGRAPIDLISPPVA